MNEQAFSRSSFPPSGWQFRQPQTNWEAPNPISNTFNQQVGHIIKHRLANPAATAKHKLATDPVTVGNELENYTRLRLGLPNVIGASPKWTPPAEAPQLPGAVKSAIAAVTKVADGAALLLEWEQSGLPPVSHELAEARAAICSDCPKNSKGKSLTEIFTVPMAALIQRRFERLEGLKLSTSKDAELSVCQPCLCPLKFKVWTPMDLIQKRLKPEVKAELDPRCWILKGE